MNNKALTLSLLMAVLAVFFVQSYVQSIEEAAKKKFGTEVLVVKAKSDIKEMDTIDETMLELGRVPQRFLEPAALSFRNRDDTDPLLQELKNLAGMIAVVPIKKGEQISMNKLTQPNLRTGLAPQVSPGRRAISIPVNEISGISKLVKPGDRVDLIAVIDAGGGKENKIAKTILQDVVVLAVGRNVTNNAARTIESDAKGKIKVKSLMEFDGFASVTVEVEPVHAQMLSLLVQGGNAIVMALRNNDDTERVGIAGIMVSDILGADASRIVKVNPVTGTTRTPATQRKRSQ